MAQKEFLVRIRGTACFEGAVSVLAEDEASAARSLLEDGVDPKLVDDLRLSVITGWEPYEVMAVKATDAVLERLDSIHLDKPVELEATRRIVEAHSKRIKELEINLALAWSALAKGSSAPCGGK
jgi:hypothetical protein